MTKKGPLSKKDKEYIESHSDAKPKVLAKKLDADGCHLGQKDMKINEARKIMLNI